MNIEVVIHEAEEGGFWGEVPARPGCALQGDTLAEFMTNLREPIEGCLSVDVPAPAAYSRKRVLDVAV